MLAHVRCIISDLVPLWLLSAAPCHHAPLPRAPKQVRGDLWIQILEPCRLTLDDGQQHNTFDEIAPRALQRGTYALASSSAWALGSHQVRLATLRALKVQKNLYLNTVLCRNQALFTYLGQKLQFFEEIRRVKVWLRRSKLQA